MTSHEEEQPLTRRRARELQSGSPDSSTPAADTGAVDTTSDEKQHEDEYRALVTSAIDLPGSQSDSGRILTRRELRALWAEQEAERQSGEQPQVEAPAATEQLDEKTAVETDTDTEAPSAPEPTQPTFDQLTFGDIEDTGELEDEVVFVEPETVDAEPVEVTAPVFIEAELIEADVVDAEIVEPAPADITFADTPPVFVEPEFVEPGFVEPEPVAVPSFDDDAAAEQDSATAEPVIFEAPDVETSIDDVPEVIEAAAAAGRTPPARLQQDVPTQAMPRVVRQEDLAAAEATLVPTVSVPPAVEETLVEASAEGASSTTAFGVPVDDEPAPVETGSTEEPFWTERVREQSKAPQGEPAFDELISRAVASAGPVTTTNALIMPTMPADGDFATPLTMTGEVMITGTFELPRSLSETGQHPRRYEAPDIDQLFDRPETHSAPDDAVPVSAASAVSSHTTANGQLLTPPSKKGSRAPIALGITAGGLGVVIVAVAVVAGFMTGVL